MKEFGKFCLYFVVGVLVVYAVAYSAGYLVMLVNSK